MKATTENIKLYSELKTLKKENYVLKSKLSLQEHSYKLLEKNSEKKISEIVTKNAKSIYRKAFKQVKVLENKVRMVEDLNSRLNYKNIQANKKITELEEKIKLLTHINEKMQSRLNMDSTNSGIPTSQTPFNKKKVIPNSRKKTNNTVGGQIGHPKNALKHFEEEEITKIVEEKIQNCPYCTCDEIEETGNVIIKDEYEYRIIVDKIRHKYIEYKCKCCGKIISKEIPKKLKADNQYGDSVQATILGLINICNVPINKTKRMMEGLTLGEISPSEGYISKLQKRASANLENFIKELKEKIIKQSMIYWDDTVVMINTKRSCMRFYGNSDLALYCAHKTKSKNGIDEDDILMKLLPEQKVMHDHNKVNYNEDYTFMNIECCAHLERDLEKVSINIPDRKWSKELKEHFQKYNHLRKKLMEENQCSFKEEEINDFFIGLDKMIIEGIEENEKDKETYFADKEKALLERLLQYRDNYTYWVLDFDIPYTNNESERSLRGIKSKMKVSGHFQNITSAEYYANIRSYIETCHKNGLNELDALRRLSDLTPYTLEEILAQKKTR